MNCSICSGKIQNKWKLCSDHLLALKNIIKAFKLWDKAQDGILKREYLKEVTNRPETGKLAIEVAQFLLEDDKHMILWSKTNQGD